VTVPKTDCTQANDLDLLSSCLVVQELDTGQPSLSHKAAGSLDCFQRCSLRNDRRVTVGRQPQEGRLSGGSRPGTATHSIRHFSRSH
jgi:hypothetical protein